MNAVAVDFVDAAERGERRLDGREKSALEGELQRWGKWWEERDGCAYSSASSIAAFLDGGAGGGRPGHRVLCDEMPNKVFWTHQRWLCLEESEKEITWNHYVAVMDPTTGRCPTPEQKAQLLGISYGNYRVRLCRARFQMLGLKSPV